MPHSLASQFLHYLSNFDMHDANLARSVWQGAWRIAAL